MVELKPCPFCGGIAVMRKNKNSFVPSYYVRCGNNDCTVICATCNRQTPEEAANEWNSRAEAALERSKSNGT